MALTEYKRKRHFDRTPEPKGAQARPGSHSFVIQKHAATNLHYDFRLELDGVLKSWAVPKGPSLDPKVKRLAMHVEDHPVEYGAFEGIIPKGEYGGGTVMLWDRGQWEPIGDPHEGYRTGRLKFVLNGEKLRGRWMLVRTSGKAAAKQDQRHWLLFKENDDEARPADEGDVLEELPLSVSTGRDLDSIAADRDWVWSSEENAKEKTTRRPKRKSATKDAASPAPIPPTKLPRAAAVRPRLTKQGTSKSSSAVQATRGKRTLARTDAYNEQEQEFAGVRLTSPDKVLYPEANITKLELAQYYKSIADWILPHIEDRPLVLVRCPEGRQKECFFQKHPAVGTPAAFRQVPIREDKKTMNYLIADDEAALISLAQIGALEIHVWGSRADKLELPDRLIFDLDPDPSVPWPRVVQSARQVRKFLQELQLESFVKTTGGKGLHLVAPIERRPDWDVAKEFCKKVADLIVAADPTHYTANMSKAARPGKIFIDYLRNGRGATAVAPYSPRSRPNAPISVPLTWKELSASVPSDYYTVRNIGKRLASLSRDPWEGIASMHQRLDRAIAAVRRLSG